MYYLGEIQVWDTGREDETIIATSGMGSDSHREPVSKVYCLTNAVLPSSLQDDNPLLLWIANKVLYLKNIPHYLEFFLINLT